MVPTAILLTGDPTGCGEQMNSCEQWLLAHLFLKGMFTDTCVCGDFFMFVFMPDI